MIDLTLPYPPSVNKYYRHPTRGALAGRHLISREGRAYRQHVYLLAIRSEPLTGRLDVQINLQPPDRRKRDIDNTQKALFDALTHAGIWVDDSQIDRLMVVRLPPTPGGAVRVHIREMEVAA